MTPPFKEALEKGFLKYKTLSTGEVLPISITGYGEALWAAKFALEFAEKEAKSRTFDALTSGELRQLREGL